jgi:quercetin dioxygenase-like cupin family protein
MQSTLIRHSNESQFEQVESGISIRSLDIGENPGDYTLQVVRIEPEGAYVELLHRHDEGFSLAYVLKGWLDVEFQEIGVQHLGLGTVVPAFNGPTHHELDAGDGLELLLLITQQNLRDDDAEKIVLQRDGDVEYRTASSGDLAYRDFELGELTGGRILARSLTARSDGLSQGDWDVANAQFQFVYVAGGWLDADLQDGGTVRLEKGSVAIQVADVGRRAMAHSDDLVLIEVVTPARTS